MMIDTTGDSDGNRGGRPSLNYGGQAVLVVEGGYQNAVLFGSNGDRRSLGTPATQRATIAYSASDADRRIW